ncbi:MAG: tRNA-dihydrouridine synthase [Candidatus Fermentibacteraceae bacterium]
MSDITCYTHGLALAPMAGYTGSPFRVVCRALGATGLVTEMVTAAGVSRRSVKSIRYLRYLPEEKPLGVQLFGARPADFSRSAELVSGLGFSFIDINAGCPVRKVLSSGSGAALLRDLPRLLEIVRATVASTHLPVTVKIRLGFSPDEPLPEGTCGMLSAAGAAAVTIHGRYRSDMFGGTVNPEGIARLSRNSPVPVVANGDVKSAADGDRLLSLAGVTGLMVGRGALGNPWIFRALSGGPSEPGPGELRQVIARQLELMLAECPQPCIFNAMRGHLVHYMKGFPGAACLRDRVVRVASPGDVLELADEAEELIWGRQDR